MREELEVVEQPSLGELNVPGIELSYTALIVTDPDLAYEVYAEIARAAGRFKTASSWWLGDLVNIGEKLYGEMYVQAMEASGLAYETLTNYAWICRHVPRSRRRTSLRFSHHAEVAALEPDEQTRWLDAATENRLSVSELRAAIKEAHPAEPREQPQWSSDAPPSYDPLPSTAVVEAAERAEAALSRPLPEGHPLWRSQAEEFARDVISLARTVDPAPDGLAEKVTCPRCGAEFEG